MMGFSAKQLTALKRKLNTRMVRTREAHGRQFSYLEGWYVISEANRIFGYDGWSRETLNSKCILARENRGTFLAIYIARVRITVQANGLTVIREGHGSGGGRGSSPAEVHDTALKIAETDATKRALATFGKPFGLELYRSDKTCASVLSLAPAQSAALPAQADTDSRSDRHPDDTTPIPRPSRYYGRRQEPTINDHLRNERRRLLSARTATPSLEPTAAEPPLGRGDSSTRIDKSALAISEPKRLRDKNHLKFVASQPCLVCGRQPCDPHHLRFAQPRAIGMKVSDEFTVPLCRGHHRQLHQAGNEVTWWEKLEINALEIAKCLWEQTRPHVATAAREAQVPSKSNGVFKDSSGAAHSEATVAPSASGPIETASER